MKRSPGKDTATCENALGTQRNKNYRQLAGDLYLGIRISQATTCDGSLESESMTLPAQAKWTKNLFVALSVSRREPNSGRNVLKLCYNTPMEWWTNHIKRVLCTRPSAIITPHKRIIFFPYILHTREMRCLWNWRFWTLSEPRVPGKQW